MAAWLAKPIHKLPSTLLQPQRRDVLVEPSMLQATGQWTVPDVACSTLGSKSTSSCLGCTLAAGSAADS